jgi:hypothetical protein
MIAPNENGVGLLVFDGYFTSTNVVICADESSNSHRQYSVIVCSIAAHERTLLQRHTNKAVNN